MNLAEIIINKNFEKHPSKSVIGFKKKDEWKSLNWSKFRDLVLKTANALKAEGIEERDKVAIYADNSGEWITMDLAIMAIGAITVPIYSTNNPEQAEYIIKDSEAKLEMVGNQEQYNACYEMLQKSNNLKKVIAGKRKIFTKPDHSFFLNDFIEKENNILEYCPKNDDDVATLIYTSGTTGTPKGVMLTHGNFIKAIDAHFEFFKFKNFENEESLAFLPLTHVFERSWTLLCLYGGAKVSFLEDTKEIAHALTQVQPSMMCAVPRFFQKIYAGVHEMVEKGSPFKKKIFAWAIGIGKQVSELKRTGKQVPSALALKYKIADTLVFKKVKAKMGGKLWFLPCGGASISPEVTEFFDAMGIHLTVGYGLTETTATLSAFPFTHFKYGTSGKTLPGVEIRIGAENEIQAKGNGIMKGYYKKPEETKAVFTEDGWLRTGDAGYVDEEGNIVLTERLKDLMKTSNGKYIAPQQIENLFSNNNYIAQITLIAEGRQFVSALIVPNFEFLQEEIKKLNIPFTNWEDVVKNEKIHHFYKQKIDEIQKEISAFERIKKFVLMPREFEISTGEMTPTLKIKRSVVAKNYADIIDKMYND